MMPQPRLAISRAVAVVCILAVTSACNLAAKEEQAQEGEGESQYASQSQAMVGAGGALAGATRLEYDHKFRFEQDDTRVDITVKGEIPLHGYQGTLRRLECKDEFVDWAFLRMYGEGTVNLDGSYDWTSGRKQCTCSLADTIKVEIDGRTFPSWWTPGDNCQSESIALKVKETWNTNPQWQCVCNTPHEVENMHIQESLAMFPQMGNPDLEKMTMVFDMSCPGDSDLVEELVMFGEGEYWWIFHSGVNEGPGRYELNLSYEGWFSSKSKEPVSCPEGMWGPPLETIESQNPTYKWEPWP